MEHNASIFLPARTELFFQALSASRPRAVKICQSGDPLHPALLGVSNKTHLAAAACSNHRPTMAKERNRSHKSAACWCVGGGAWVSSSAMAPVLIFPPVLLFLLYLLLASPCHFHSRNSGDMRRIYFESLGTFNRGNSKLSERICEAFCKLAPQRRDNYPENQTTTASEHNQVRCTRFPGGGRGAITEEVQPFPGC